MKSKLTTLCWPLLKFFETSEEAKNYKKSHRTVLMVLGVLFCLLSVFSAGMASASSEIAAFIPVVVFLGVGAVALIVGTLGSDGAVSKIWGGK